MDLKTFLSQIEEAREQSGGSNPQVEVYTSTGREQAIVRVYEDDGIVCLDVEDVQGEKTRWERA